MRASCQPEGANATHPGVRAKLNGLAGKWHFDLDTESRFPSLNYSASVLRRGWNCSGDGGRAGRYRKALWVADGCRSLSDQDFVKPLLGEPLHFLPPNVTAVSIGNSYLSQMAHSLVFRAWKVGQVEHVCDLDPAFFDLPLDSIRAQAPMLGDLCRSDSPLVSKVWEKGSGADGRLKHLPLPRGDRIVVLTNGARLYISYNSRMQLMTSASMLAVAAMLVGRESIADVDVVLVNTGNSLMDEIRIARPCGDGEEAAQSSLPCVGLTTRLTDIASKRQSPMDLSRMPVINVTDVMRELGQVASGDAPRRSQVVLIAPHNSRGHDYDANIQGNFPAQFFLYGGVFGSDSDTCQSDPDSPACSHGYRHQCMPGPPDSMSDALHHVVWEEICATA